MTVPDEHPRETQRTTLANMRAALELSSHILPHAPNKMANQLVGRLGELPELHNRAAPTGPTFRLISRSLTAPGGPLLRDSGGAYRMSGDGLSFEGLAMRALT